MTIRRSAHIRDEWHLGMSSSQDNEQGILPKPHQNQHGYGHVMRTYAIDAPGVSIHKEHASRADPAISTIGGHILNSCCSGWRLGEFEGGGRMVFRWRRPDLAIKIMLGRSHVLSLHDEDIEVNMSQVELKDWWCRLLCSA